MVGWGLPHKQGPTGLLADPGHVSGWFVVHSNHRYHLHLNIPGWESQHHYLEKPAEGIEARYQERWGQVHLWEEKERSA